MHETLFNRPERTSGARSRRGPPSRGNDPSLWSVPRHHQTLDQAATRNGRSRSQADSRPACTQRRCFTSRPVEPIGSQPSSNTSRTLPDLGRDPWAAGLTCCPWVAPLSAWAGRKKKLGWHFSLRELIQVLHLVLDRLPLYDLVDPWLPELAQRMVMHDPDGTPKAYSL